MTDLRTKVAQGIAVGITDQRNALGLTWDEAAALGQDIARRTIPEGAVIVTETTLTEALYQVLGTTGFWVGPSIEVATSGVSGEILARLRGAAGE